MLLLSVLIERLSSKCMAHKHKYNIAKGNWMTEKIELKKSLSRTFKKNVIKNLHKIWNRVCQKCPWREFVGLSESYIKTVSTFA